MTAPRSEWSDLIPVDSFCPHGEALFEDLRADATEMAVASVTVAEHFNVIEDICPGMSRVLYIRFLMRSFLSELKNDSATVLIPAVSTPAHAQHQIVGPAEPLPVITAVLTTLDAILRVKTLSGCC